MLLPGEAGRMFQIADKDFLCDVFGVRRALAIGEREPVHHILMAPYDVLRTARGKRKHFNKLHIHCPSIFKVSKPLHP
jgi:hypothetical protein